MLLYINPIDFIGICLKDYMAPDEKQRRQIEAKKPAYKLTIDFGVEIGIKKSSAQITENYTKEALLNSLVLCVTNFPPRQIGPFISEVLTLGVPAENKTVILIRPDKNVPLGGQLF